MWKSYVFFISSLIVAALAAEEEHLSRERRYAPFGYGFPFNFPNYNGAYAGPGGAYAGAGAAAGGFPFGPSPWFQPRSFFPWNWFPPITFPQNWYEGPNVCKEVKVRNDNSPDDFNSFFSFPDSPNLSADYSHQQEQCKGNNNVYVCITRTADASGKSVVQGTKYECCHGFVRHPSGPGCTEIASSQPQPVPQAPEKPIDKNFYSLVPNDKVSQKSFSSSSSGSIASTSVGKVPAV